MISVERSLPQEEEFGLLRFNETPSEWVLKQMNVEGIRTHAPEGRLTPSNDVQRPSMWRFARLPNVRNDPRSRQFRRFYDDSWVLPSDDHVQSFLRLGAQAIASLGLDDPPNLPCEKPYDDDLLMTATESSSFKKLTIQKGTLPTWHLDLPHPGIPSEDGLRAFSIAALSTAEEYARAATIYKPNAPPSNTVGGWPSFASGPPSKILASCFASADDDFDVWMDEAMAWSASAGIIPETAMGYGLGGRSGPLRKPQTLWMFRENTWVPHIQASGCSQRNRIVYMACAGVNVAMWDLYVRLKSAQVNISGMWRDGADPERLRGRQFRYEADVSGFDTSMSRELFEVVAWALSRVFPDLRQVISNWRRVELLPLLTPPVDISKGEGCGVRMMPGGLKSGLILTSVMGSFIQRSMVRMALEAQGKSFDDVSVCIQGDDVALGSETPLDGDRWKEVYSQMGMDCELTPGLSFLSKHITKQGDVLPIAGRLIQQSCSNEHELRGGDWVTGILMLGFIARTENSDLLPLRYQSAVNDVLRSVAWLRPFHAKTLSQTVRNVKARGQRSIQRALLKKQGVSWIESELRGAEHSPLGRWLATQFPLLMNLTEGIDDLTFATCQKVNALSWSLRKEIAHEGWRALNNGKDEENYWFLTVKNRFG